MKSLLALTLSLTAAVSAYGAGSALVPDGSRYSVEQAADFPALLLERVSGDIRETIPVPTTDDAAIESEPHVAYDALTGVLFVVWTRQSEGSHELRYATRAADGTWSEPHTVTGGAERILGTQIAVTHGVEQEVLEGETPAADSTSVMHLAWWKVGETSAEPWYAFIAMQRDAEPVTAFANLVDLATITADGREMMAEAEDTGAAVHPPLAMVRRGQEVDVVFGSVQQTAVTSVTIKPRKIGGTARIFVPVGRDARRTPRANLVSTTTQPVQALISRNGRIVLYAPGERFSFVVLDNGEWTPVRSLRVDEKLTLDHVLKDLQRTVEELETLTLPQAER